MRIAMIAPVWETVPPTAYGGIELIVDLLARYMAAEGHHVTLFATGDSTCEVETQWTEPAALRSLGHDTWNNHMAEAIHLANAYQSCDRFDLYHNHAGPLGNAFATLCPVPTLTTLHGPILASNERYFRTFREHPYVSISMAQRKGAPDLAYVANIYHGIETHRYTPGPKQDYLLFLGRISPEKGTHTAIEAALATGMPLVIAAKVDPYDQTYFEEKIAPHLDGSQIRYIGEVSGARKQEVLSGARALLHLIQWPEPFGLTMAESLASGTPVIAMAHGSIPEVITHGQTGFVVRSLQEAIEAIGRLDELSPETCRREAVARYSVERMVAEYLGVYDQVLAAAPRRQVIQEIP
ncbi:MAG TPA: glycosyltransferase family 4 protein [Stenomitos sp.]